jgi:5-hydroxyisourate hydrolase-like protein (transthyretin family)
MMKKTKWLVSSLLLLVMALVSIMVFPGSVQAEKPLTEFESLAEGADTIVIGQVDQQISRWNEEHTRINSWVTLKVEESLKGDIESDNITLSLPGGEVDGITQVVSDTPSFYNGERAAVLLSRQRENTYEIYGLNKGKYTLGKGELVGGRVSLEDLKTRVNNTGSASGVTGRPDIQSYSADASVNATASAALSITSVSPSSASAGTNSSVTITGSGFGTAAGTVYFFYCSGEACLAGNVTSWTNTSIVVTVPVGTVDGYAASASSGWLYVRTSTGSESSYYPFTVTFSYGGVKWSGSNPVVQYYVNPNSTDASGSLNAVKAAASAWSNVSGSSFSFDYAGSTGSTGYGYNSRNEILWARLNSSGIIARAVYWFSGANMVEADIEFNTYFSWSSSGTAVSGKMDVQSIALHEMGHWLNLRDLYGNLSGYPTDTSKTMYGFGSTGSPKTALSSEDQQGIRWIYPGSSSASFAITSPNGGESWQAGSTKTITWSYSGSPGSYVSLQLYRSGSLDQSIVSSTSAGSGGSGSYSWNIPVTLENGSDYKVKVTSLSNSSWADYSNNYFSITGGSNPPALNITSPDGNETWQVGTSHNITWTYTGDPGSYVKIQLYKSGSASSTVVSSTPIGSGGQGSYAWTLSNALAEGSTYTIKISSVSNSDCYDTSDAYFTINSTKITALTLNSPNGGESWQAGTSHTISWSYTGDPGSYIAVQLYNNGSPVSNIVSSTAIGSGGQGSYVWTLSSSQAAGSKYTVKISSVSNSACYDTSNAYFTINSVELPVLTVTSPNGNETWQAGTSNTISWSYTGTPGLYLKIQLYQNGNPASTIVSSTSIGNGGQGSYAWTVPSTIAAGSNYSIKISSTVNTTCYDYSDSYFTITAALLPTFTVESPDGGETWQAGTSQKITWSYTGNPGSYVKIQLYQGDKSYCTVVSSTSRGSSGKGSYTWAVPTTITAGSSYLIKISSTGNPAYFDYSDNSFSVKAAELPTITVTAPGNGDVWQMGKDQTITWSYTGNPGSKVKIVLYKDGSLNKTVVASTSIGSSGQGSYLWTVPLTLSAGSRYSIKVYSTSKSSYYDYNDGYFVIAQAEKPAINLISPDGGETWQAGTTHNITWSYTGNPGNKVKIELYKKGVLKTTIITSTSIGSNGSGSYSWKVPYVLPFGSDYKIKIRSTASTKYYDYSDDYLTISVK